MAEKVYDGSRDMITGDKLMLFVQTQAAGAEGFASGKNSPHRVRHVVRYRNQHGYHRHQQQNVRKLERVSGRTARIHRIERIVNIIQIGALLLQHIEEAHVGPCAHSFLAGESYCGREQRFHAGRRSRQRFSDHHGALHDGRQRCDLYVQRHAAREPVRWRTANSFPSPDPNANHTGQRAAFRRPLFFDDT